MESIRYVEDQATVEGARFKSEKKPLCMATTPSVIREIEYDSGSDVSTETSCLKRGSRRKTQPLPVQGITYFGTTLNAQIRMRL